VQVVLHVLLLRFVYRVTLLIELSIRRILNASVLLENTTMELTQSVPRAIVHACLALRDLCQPVNHAVLRNLDISRTQILMV
jgi:hypothetical protein